MGDKKRNQQSGAQDRGLAITGNNNDVNTGTQFKLSGSGATTINSGITGSELSDIFGSFTTATASQQQAATPPALTPASTGTVTDKKNQWFKVGLVIAFGILGIILFKKFFK